ncbi:MAG: hypothetical protein GY765_11215 [bacterium]|nr:hypothetical protein [bacterium]
MKLMQIAILTALLIILINCSEKKDHLVKRIRTADVPYALSLVKEKEAKIEAEGLPAFVRDDDSSNIMIRMETKNTKFLEYDSELQLQETHVIRYGQGPDECLLPMVAGKDVNGIYIFEPALKRYYSYDSEFKNRKRIDSKNLEANWDPHGTKYSSSEKTLLTCFYNFINQDEDGYHLYLRKMKGDRLTDIKIMETKLTTKSRTGKIVFGTPLHFTLFDNNAFVLNKTNYSLMQFDLEGNVLQEVLVEGLDDVHFSSRERGEWIETMDAKLSSTQFTFPERLWHPCWIIPVGNGLAVGRRDSYKPGKKEWVEADYFDKNLEYLGKIKLPCFDLWNAPSHINADILFFSKGNKLFFLEERVSDTEEDYYLTRWRIIDEKR